MSAHWNLPCWTNRTFRHLISFWGQKKRKVLPNLISWADCHQGPAVGQQLTWQGRAKPVIVQGFLGNGRNTRVNLASKAWTMQMSCEHSAISVASEHWSGMGRQAENGIRRLDYALPQSNKKHISQVGRLFPIYGKIKTIQNHQRDFVEFPLFSSSLWLFRGRSL